MGRWTTIDPGFCFTIRTIIILISCLHHSAGLPESLTASIVLFSYHVLEGAMYPRFIMFLVLTVISVSTAIAQDSVCPTLIQTALDRVNTVCAETGRNQVCYVNATLKAQPQSHIVNFAFENPGDIAAVTDIQSLSLSGLNEGTGEWGVSLMKLQANLPDTLPGQNVTFLFFGNVSIENAVDEESTGYTAMQVFYFSSGLQDTGCNEAPVSGLVVQTPEGAGTIEIVANEVTIQLGSTIFLQAQPGDSLSVYVIEGQASVTALDGIQVVPAGSMVSVALDENLAATEPPGTPEPYTVETIMTLADVVAVLPQSITLTEAGIGVVSRVLEDDSCLITTTNTVNLRTGPGTVYTRSDGLAAGQTATLAGQAIGSDGFTWWKLADGAWVRSDVVEATAGCAVLPVVSDIPPMPTHAPVQTSNYTHYLINYCIGTPNSQPIYGGDTVRFKMGCCGQPTQEENDAMTGGNTGWITLDGVPLGVFYTGSMLRPEGFYSDEVTAHWVATPGPHTVAAGWPIAEQPVCTFTVASR